MNELHEVIRAVIVANKKKGYDKGLQKRGMEVICNGIIDEVYEK